MKRRACFRLAPLWLSLVLAGAPLPARSREAAAPLRVAQESTQDLILEPVAEPQTLEMRPVPTQPDAAPRVSVGGGMVFPVAGKVSWSDTFGASRGGGRRRHLGQDLMAAKMTPAVACFDGTVYPRSHGGHNLLTLRGDNGWSAEYMHLNNDTPGTDDGQGTPEYTFAPGIRPGVHVVAGQLLGWVGDSGNAEGTDPHLHFELRNASGAVVRSARLLQSAQRLSGPLGSGGEVMAFAPGKAAALRARPIRLASRGSAVGRTRVKPRIQLYGVISSAAKGRLTLAAESIRHLAQGTTTRLDSPREKRVLLVSTTRVLDDRGKPAGRDRLVPGAIVEITGPDEGVGTSLKAEAVVLRLP